VVLDPTAPPYQWPPPEWGDPFAPLTPPQIAAPGVPVAEEVPADALAPPVPPPVAPPAESALIEFPDDFVGKREPLMPLPFEVDAVSDAGYRPPDETPLGAAPLPTDAPLEAGRPAELGETERGQLLAREALTDPEASLQRRIDEDTAHEERVADDLLAAGREDRARAERVLQVERDARERTRQARAKLDDESQVLADTPIDQDGWKESRSTLQTIAAYIAVIGGGLASGSTGGRNMGLEAIQKQIDQHIDIQKANLASKRSEIARRSASLDAGYALDMEDTRALETERQAIYKHTIQEMQVKHAQLDPRGTSARRYADGIVDMVSRSAAAREKFERQSFEDNMKLGEFALKQDAALLARQSAEAKMRLDAAKAAGAGGSGVKMSPQEIKQRYGIDVPDPMTAKEVDRELNLLKKSKDLTGTGNEVEARRKAAEATKWEAEAKKSTAEAKATETGFQLADPETGEPYIKKDGEPFVVMDASERQKLRGIGVAALNIRRLADKMTELKKKIGGGSTVLGTADAQELTSLAKQIDFETYKGFELGAPSAGDQEMAEGVKGGVGATEFVRDNTAGILAYADGIEKKANAHYKGAGYTGKTIKFHRASDLKKSAPSVVDEISSSLAKAEYDPPDPFALPPLLGIAPGADPQVARRHKEADEKLGILAAYSEQSGNVGEEARLALGELAERAVSPALRAKAKEILKARPGTTPPRSR
jgi:hypothetical protein